jgi:hypothetical protein
MLQQTEQWRSNEYARDTVNVGKPSETKKIRETPQWILRLSLGYIIKVLKWGAC